MIWTTPTQWCLSRASYHKHDTDTRKFLSGTTYRRQAPTWQQRAPISAVASADSSTGFNLIHHVPSDLKFRVQQVVVGLITSVVSARLLGPKDFGLTAVIISYPMLLGALLAVKSGTVTTRYISAFRERYQDDALESICLLGFTLDFVVSLTAFILVAATAWWVAEHFFYAPGAAWLMVAFAAAFPIWSLHGTSGAILT